MLQTRWIDLIQSHIFLIIWMHSDTVKQLDLRLFPNFFKLYALDSVLSLESGATKAQVEKAMEGHILAEGQLMGKYKR